MYVTYLWSFEPIDNFKIYFIECKFEKYTLNKMA